MSSINLVAEAAQEYATDCFASTADHDFRLSAAVFECCGGVIRRVDYWSLPEEDVLHNECGADGYTAWVMNATVPAQMVDDDGDVHAFEHEVVEIFAISDTGGLLIGEAAVVRVAGLPPCLGPFRRINL
jgi:hypothetical protein